LSLTLPEILELIDGMDKESRAIQKELIKMCWYMRGGVTLDEIYATDRTQRDLIVDLIKENLETTKDTRLPFF
jgi:hypothetical protein